MEDLAVLLDLHIQKKQSQDVGNASTLVCPSEQYNQDNEIAQKDRQRMWSVHTKEEMLLCDNIDKPRDHCASQF